MQDLACLVEHLHFLLGVAVVGEDVDLRNHIVGELIGELVDRNGFALNDLPVLLLKFGHGLRAGAGGRLVAGHMHAAYVREPVDRLEHHDHHDGGAVGVRDYAARAHQSVLRVAFGYHEGNVVIHAERARIVDHHCAVLRYGLREFARSARSRRYEGVVHSLEVVVMLKELHLDLLAAECVSASGAPL